MEKHGLDDLKDVEIITPSQHSKFQDFYENTSNGTKEMVLLSLWR